VGSALAPSRRQHQSRGPTIWTCAQRTYDAPRRMCAANESRALNASACCCIRSRLAKRSTAEEAISRSSDKRDIAVAEQKTSLDTENKSVAATATPTAAIEPVAHPDNVKNWWYIKTLFEYTNSLMERTEKRATYLFVGNSVIATAYFSVVKFLSEQRRPFGETMSHVLINFNIPKLEHVFWLIFSIIIILPTFLIALSVLMATRATLPVILRFDIKLNQSFVAKFTPAGYRDFLDNRSAPDLRDDFIDEIHVLSMILDIKNARLAIAMKVFMFAMASTVPVLLFFTVGQLF
jgi:hypothetical protein